MLYIYLYIYIYNIIYDDIYRLILKSVLDHVYFDIAKVDLTRVPYLYRLVGRRPLGRL